MVPELDSSAARGAADAVQNQFRDATRNIGTDFSKNLKSGIDEAVRGVSGSFGPLSSQAESVFSGMSSKAALAAVGVAGIGVAAVAVGKGLYELGARWDDISDNITGRTGKMGVELTAITDTVKEVGRQSAVSLEGIGQLAGGVAQSLHLSGDAATVMTQKLADVQQVTKQIVDTKELGKAFRLFDITDIQTEIDTLGQLTAASQKTDIPINNLLTTLNTTGKAGKEAGLGLQQTVGLMLALQESGVSFEKGGQALAKALQSWAKEGRDSNVALAETVTQIKALIDVGNDSGAQNLAFKMFGGLKGGGIDFFNAIKDGTLDVNSLRDALVKLGDTKNLIEDEKKSTEDWHEAWKKIANQLQSDLGPAATKVFNGINGILEFSSRNLHQVNNDVKDLATTINSLKPDALASALGLPSLPGGAAPAPPGPVLPTTRPGATTTGLGPNFYKDWYKTPEQLKKEQANQPPPFFDPSLWSINSIPVPGGPPGGAQLPGAGPGAFEVDPQKVFSAQSALQSAKDTLEQGRLHVLELEAKGNVSQSELLSAKNNILEEERAYQSAAANLADAQQGTWKKLTESTNSLSSSFGQLGAFLDKDLGISKGLPGMADNLVRFLATLAAAPMLGQLEATGAAQERAAPGSSGGLLTQMLGRAGLFGSGAGGAGAGGGGGSFLQNVLGAASGGTGGGQPYGLPPGSNSGGYGGGGVQFPDWVNQLGAAFGVKPSTYPGHQESNRNEPGYAPNPQDLNRGIDWSGPVDNLQKFADYLKTIPQDLEQVIWQNPNTGQKIGIGGGQINPGYYPQSTYDEHGGNDPNNIHVHTRQSRSIPLPGGGGGGGANWDATMQGESSGNWATNTGNGYYGGLQFKQSSWELAGGTQYAARADLASPQQQKMVADQLLAIQGPGAWPDTFQTYDEGGWLPPGITVAQNNTGQPEPILPPGVMGPNIIGGPGGGGPPPGPGPGSVQPGMQPSGKGGGSSQSGAGGLIGAAAGMFPGGQAAAALAMRTIKFGGQLASIGIMGAMETFLPGGTTRSDPSKSLIGRVASGIAGGQPASPNMAAQAKPPQPIPVNPNTTQHGTGQGQPPGPAPMVTMINPVFQNGIDGQAVGRDIAREQRSYTAGDNSR